MDIFDNEKNIYLAEDWWIHPDVINVPEELLDSVIEDLTFP